MLSHQSTLYCFISNYDQNYIKNLDNKINIIFRNYETKLNFKKLKNLCRFCKSTGKKIFLANEPKMALNIGFDGVYVPSFNKTANLNSYKSINNFTVLGSAHNYKEIKEKEKQGIEIIFISPVFKVKKSKKFLGVKKFNFLSMLTNKKTIALGGINESNFKKLRLLRADGFSSISFFKKKGP